MARDSDKLPVCLGSGFSKGNFWVADDDCHFMMLINVSVSFFIAEVEWWSTECEAVKNMRPADADR